MVMSPAVGPTASDPAWAGLPPLPIRVLVKGASSTVAVAPPGGPRTEQTYAWWLEVCLTAAGLPAQVRNGGAQGQKVGQALCAWHDEVELWSPDVVILNYGQYEGMPGLLPYWLERHATGWHHHSGIVRDRYRKHILMPVWRRLNRMQRPLDRLMSRPGPFRSSPGHLGTEMSRYVDQVRLIGSPLVLVMDTWQLGPKWRQWFPGMQARADRNGQVLAKWVADRGDPDVRLFRVSEIVDRYPPEISVPDGAHFSAQVHREIAEALAAEVLPWAAGQPHLDRPGLDAFRFGAQPPP